MRDTEKSCLLFRGMEVCASSSTHFILVGLGTLSLSWDHPVICPGGCANYSYAGGLLGGGREWCLVGMLREDNPITGGGGSSFVVHAAGGWVGQTSQGKTVVNRWPQSFATRRMIVGWHHYKTKGNSSRIPSNYVPEWDARALAEEEMAGYLEQENDRTM